jgi:hypothetical protein
MQKTSETFINEVYNLVKDEYTVLGEYQKARNKIMIKHNLCGYEYLVMPSNFLRGRRCPECNKKHLSKLKSKTHEQFCLDLFNLYRDEYIILNKYKKANTKVLIKHNIETCGYEWYVEPNSILMGTGCPKCAGVLKKTTNSFKQEVYDLVGNEYEVIGEYVNANTKIKIKHNICGNVFKMLPHNFLRGQRCPFEKADRIRKQQAKDAEIFKQEVYNLVENEYEVIGEYINNHTKIKIKHMKCNNVYDVTPMGFLKGRRCSKCKGGVKKSHEEFISDFYNLVGDEYAILGIYKNNNTKITVRHNICNHQYDVTPGNFMNGRRCPQCFESKGEQKIRHWLDSNNIIYLPEYDKINGLVGIKGGQLRFDFAIFKDINKTIVKKFIEYDGEFHFKKFYKEQNFETLQIHDKLKNEYCLKNNIKLLRIPYWEFDNIETILHKELNIS